MDFFLSFQKFHISLKESKKYLLKMVEENIMDTGDDQTVRKCIKVMANCLNGTTT